MVYKRSVGFDPVDPLEKVSSDGWMIRSEGESVPVLEIYFMYTENHKSRRRKKQATRTNPNAKIR
jgi:hypothetical protein